MAGSVMAGSPAVLRGAMLSRWSFDYLSSHPEPIRLVLRLAGLAARAASRSDL